MWDRWNGSFRDGILNQSTNSEKLIVSKESTAVQKPRCTRKKKTEEKKKRALKGEGKLRRGQRKRMRAAEKEEKDTPMCAKKKKGGWAQCTSRKQST